MASRKRNPRVAKRELYEPVPFEEQVAIFAALKTFALGPALPNSALAFETKAALVDAFDRMDRYAR